MPVLLTRPETAARRFAAQVRGRLGTDWPVILSPLTELTFLSPPLDLDGVDGVIFTSETGVAALSRLTGWRGARAWCVGARTAEAARSAGFEATAGPGDAAGLLAMLTAPGGPRHPFWARGARVSVDLAAALAGHHVPLRTAVVYDRARLSLSAEARAHLSAGGGVIWPVFSAGSAEDGLAALARHPLTGIRAVAISTAVADLLAARLGSVRVADRPNAAGMIEAVAECAGRDG